MVWCQNTDENGADGVDGLAESDWWLSDAFRYASITGNETDMSGDAMAVADFVSGMDLQAVQSAGFAIMCVTPYASKL
jgi:hypothetical protein